MTAPAHVYTLRDDRVGKESPDGAVDRHSFLLVEFLERSIPSLKRCLAVNKRSLGFTLIELLIVVAIIAILAAIAVPNFLEAQTRAKVSRSKADLRTLAVAIEAYTVDYNTPPTDTGGGQNGITRPYPPGNVPGGNFVIGYEITTPISYVTSTSAFKDPFRTKRSDIANNPILLDRDLYQFANWFMRNKGTPGLSDAAYEVLTGRTGTWALWGAGPDTFTNNSNLQATGDFQVVTTIPLRISYDPTNGTISVGDLHRTQKYGDGVLEQENPGNF